MADDLMAAAIEEATSAALLAEIARAKAGRAVVWHSVPRHQARAIITDAVPFITAVVEAEVRERVAADLKRLAGGAVPGVQRDAYLAATAAGSPGRKRLAVADFAAAQRRAWANKVAKGFNTTDVPMEFGLLVEEIGEAFSKWRKGRPGLGEELADVAIFLFGLAEMTGVDLAAEVEAKLAVNEARAYVWLPNGTPVKEEARNG